MLLQAIKRTFSCRFAMIKLVSLYKKPIRLFDQSVGSKIAKIPDSLYGPLAVLCLIIHPVGWLLLVIIGSGIALAREDAFGWILSVATVILILQADVIKLILRRPRPVSLYAQNMRMKSYSFPSAHAYAAAAGSGYLLAYLAPYISISTLNIVFIFLTGLSLVVAVARVRLQAHFPSDVAGGLILGTLASVICLFIATWLS